MFKVKQNDIFAKNMSKKELYNTTKMSKSMKMTPFLIKLQKQKEMDEFLNKLITKNGVTNY